LIVDDDPNIIITFKFGIECATNRRIAVDAYNDPRIVPLDFQSNLYDVLLTDINMPYRNGF